MNVGPQPDAAGYPPKRSIPVTVLAWCVIGVSALLIPVSLFALLMILTGSQGASSGGFFEALIVLCGPAALFVAGVGLLRRKRWGQAFVIACALAGLAWNVYGIIKGPNPGSTYVSPDGVRTTVLPSPAQYSVPMMAVCAGVAAFLLLPGSRAEFGPGALVKTRAFPFV